MAPKHSLFRIPTAVLHQCRGPQPIAQQHQLPRTGGGSDSGVATPSATQSAPAPAAALSADAGGSLGLSASVRRLQAELAKVTGAAAPQRLETLPHAVTHRVHDVQKDLLRGTAPRPTVLRAVCVLRRLLATNMPLDTSAYADLMQALCKNEELQWDASQRQRALAVVIQSAGTAFSSNAVPLLERLMPAYILSCLQLEMPDGLAVAGNLVSQIHVQKGLPAWKYELLADAFEDFAISMFHHAEMWKNVAFQRNRLRVITKAGPRTVYSMRVSLYHTRVLRRLVALFDRLEEKTDGIKRAFSGATDEAPTVTEYRIGSPQEAGYVTVCPDGYVHEEADATVLLRHPARAPAGPRGYLGQTPPSVPFSIVPAAARRRPRAFRKLFRRAAKLPDLARLDELVPASVKQQLAALRRIRAGKGDK
ncbi:hypothetical protein DIPPA_11548 [Diplonema papillatum]|nr:hypothetical protein DIPPA_11548 [Diplonema papillatum]